MTNLTAAPTAGIIPTDNPGHGFYGTVAKAGYSPDSAWELAFHALTSRHGAGSAVVRDFLDAATGRHLAGEVVARLEAGADLDTAVAAAATSRDHAAAFRRAQERAEGAARRLAMVASAGHA